jgi:hypothetical protein
VSGQCLSASGAGRALTPATHLSLGGPLPRQLANTTWAPPEAKFISRQKDAFPTDRWPLPGIAAGYCHPQGRLPMHYCPLRHFPRIATVLVRLACLIHAANVRSEPGSNPSQNFAI